MAIPLSLYIHTPWCERKCPYCDFNSHTRRNEIPEQDYLNALLTDLEDQLTWVQQRPIHSIFIGGGTPSLMSAGFYQQLFDKLKQKLLIPEKTEITLEANPGTVIERHLIGYHNAGINRISFGVQSLQNEKLTALGRIHSADEAKRAVINAQEIGITNINIDLMFGLPNQTIDDALQDLTQGLALTPKHLSWYQLTLEPNTLFFHQPPKLPHDDDIWEMQEQGQALLAEHDFLQYEISAYSQREYECAHNLNYWTFGDYLGIGAGAHSKLTDLTSRAIRRRSSVKHPTTFLDPSQKKIASSHIIPKDQLVFEYMLNALRLHRPISLLHLQQATRVALAEIQTPLQHAKNQGLLYEKNQQLYVTPLGFRFLNDLQQLFL